MLNEWFNLFSSQLSNVYVLFIIINAFIHIIFAGAVAKDAGSLKQKNKNTILVSGITWSFATLIGGVFVAALYYIIHHSKFIDYKH